jgi:MFS family permease
MYLHVLLSTGFWIQQIVVGWIIYDQTNSPLLTSLALGIDTIPILFGGFIGGAIVDRFNPKLCIIFVTSVQFILVSFLAAIMFLNIFSIWYIYPIVLFIGFTWVIYDPSKIRLGMQLVDKDSISNIFGMWISGFNLPRILASILAGYLIVYLGAKYALLLESLIILSAFFSIYFLKYEHTKSQNPLLCQSTIYRY